MITASKLPSSSVPVAADAPGSGSGPGPVPVELDAVVRLFADTLGGVSFPEVDAARLHTLADEVRRCAGELDRARQTLAAAETSASAAVDALRIAATRGLAYARIYADAEPDRQPLAAAIDALTVSAPVPRIPAVTGKRRGRPRKIPADSLFPATGLDAAGVAADPARAGDN